MTSRQTLEQQRAAFAWAKIDPRRSKNAMKDYRNLAKSAPALVAGNGLLPTLLFLKSKKKPQHCWLLSDIQEWLIQRGMPVSPQSASPEDFLAAVTKVSPPEYRQATDEALQLLRWIRQFASAFGDEQHAP